MPATQVRLHRPVPSDLRAEFTDKLAYSFERLVAYELDPSGEFVTVSVASADDLEIASQRIDALARGMLDRHRAAERVVTFEHRVETAHRAPIWEALEAARSVHMESPGLLTLAGDSARLATALDALFVRMADEIFDATHHHYPTLLEMNALDRCSYFGSFPQHITFAPHVRQDLEVLSEFAAAEGRAEEKLATAIARPTHVLSPAVCFHAYLFLRDAALEERKTLTACGRCFRYEGKNFHLGERLWDFSMREIIFVGDKAWIEESRARAIAWTEALVRALDLDAWIESANDPFFLNNFVAQRYFQRSSQTKFELQLALPYASSSLAAASFNLHADFFGRSFGITWAGEPAHTGCVAFGIERWVWALHAQFGPRIDAWPRGLRDTLGV